MWIFLAITALFILFFIYIRNKWNKIEKEFKHDKELQAALEEHENELQAALEPDLQGYNRKCIDVKYDFKEGKINSLEAWKQLEELGTKYNIPEERRTTSLKGVWVGTYKDGTVWTVKDEPGWEQKIPKD